MSALREAAARTGGWADLPFFTEDLPRVAAALDADGRPCAPRPEAAFRALELTQPEAVRCVILGQDPYPTPGHAHGLAFSVPEGTRPLPPSLRNVLAELHEDQGERAACDLTDWARQGVLMWNAAPTVPEGAIDGHRALGWDRLTAQILARIDARPTALVLWGKRAQTAARGLDGERHLKIETAHPSPLSARRGFLGSRPFGRVNAWLDSRGEAPIDWLGAGGGTP
jgi:uracil-DNA glycosylase